MRKKALRKFFIMKHETVARFMHKNATVHVPKDEEVLVCRRVILPLYFRKPTIL